MPLSETPTTRGRPARLLLALSLLGGCVPLDVGDLPTGSVAPTHTPRDTPTPALSPSPSVATSSPSPSPSPSAPPTPTPSTTPSLSATPSQTAAPSPSESPSESPSASPSAPTPSPSPTPSTGPTPTQGPDEDGDGFGVGWDCDDGDPQTYPGAFEACEGRDNDCDGAIDEGDADGDGAPRCALEDLRADCDDDDPLRSPLHTYEYRDQLDNDCDDKTDENQDPAGAPWVLDGPRQEEIGWCGSAMGATGDLNRDGWGDFIVTCPRATGLDKGVSYVFFGAPGRPASPDAMARLALEGDGNYHFAGSAFAAGDFNGDGIPDLLIGQPGVSAATLLVGPLNPRADALSLSQLGKTGQGTSFTSTGTSVALVDVDGDGRAEIFVGSPSAQSWKGRTEVVAGGVQLANRFDFDEEGAALPSHFIYPETPPFLGGEGSAMAALGDFDDDGFQDLAIGSFWAGGRSDSLPGERRRAGAVEILYGGPMEGLGSRERVAVISGAEGAYFGAALASAGDFNGDGIPDLAVGAPGVDGPAEAGGAGYIIAGGARLRGDLFIEELDARILGVVSCDRPDCQLGTLYNASALGDINGDGLGDVAFGAVGYGSEGEGGRDRGAIGVFLGLRGPGIGARDLTQADAFFLGSRGDDKLGAVGALGDLDGDGFGELLLGAFEAQVDPEVDGQDTGRAYLYWGYGRGGM